ncbi:MAG: hypothetical protein HY711_06175 [Candidatus Melainabacteria bacterium]|nr:hypothetical protein [Candidatus Melainabacteria bacterium]
MACNENEAALTCLKERWLKNPEDTQAIRHFLELLQASGKKGLAVHIHRICQDPQSFYKNPQTLAEVGFQLIDNRHYDIAAMLLKQCLSLVPDEPFVNYELGFALMLLRKVQEAIPYFEYALVKVDDFDTRLNLAACYISTRQVNKAQEMINSMSAFTLTAQEASELTHQRMVLRRLAELTSKGRLGARDWQYVQYGSLLVRPLSKQFATDASLWSETYFDIGTTLLTLRGILDGLGETFELVEFLDSPSEPLATALADVLGTECEPYDRKVRHTPTLLVTTWAGNLIKIYKDLTAHTLERSLFAYGLSSESSLPITPDIVGVLQPACIMPWEAGSSTDSFPAAREAKTDTYRDAADKIMSKMHLMKADPEIIKNVQEAVSYYTLKRERLVLGNQGVYPQRPQYRAEVPLNESS